MMANIWPKKGTEPVKADVEPSTAEELKRLDEGLYLRLPNRLTACLASSFFILSQRPTRLIVCDLQSCTTSQGRGTAGDATKRTVGAQIINRHSVHRHGSWLELQKRAGGEASGANGAGASCAPFSVAQSDFSSPQRGSSSPGAPRRQNKAELKPKTIAKPEHGTRHAGDHARTWGISRNTAGAGSKR